MSTAFSYPNGDYIDVFLGKVDGTSLWPSFALSDFGQTFLYLRSAQVEMLGSKSKRDIVDSILEQLQVRLSHGNLLVDLNEAEPVDLSDAIFRLSQACLRISDFAAHQRLRSENPFKDDIEGFLEASGILFVKEVKLLGRFNNEVKVDFETVVESNKSLVCVLSSLTYSSAHSSSNEVFRKWYDLRDAGFNLVTIYSSSVETLNDSDRKRLGDYSTLIAYPANEHKLKDTLAARR